MAGEREVRREVRRPNGYTFQNLSKPQLNRNSRSGQSDFLVDRGVPSKVRSVENQGNKTIKTTIYQYGNQSQKSYLEAAAANIDSNTTSENQHWTHVTKRKHGKVRISFVFVGNIPTNATSMDIWVAVKGAEFFTTLYTPANRDRNNNRFAFLALKPTISFEDVLPKLVNTKLFGRILGFDKAKRGPPHYSVGLTFTPSATHQGGTTSPKISPNCSNQTIPNTPAEMKLGSSPKHPLNISNIIDLELTDALRYSLIGITHYPDNLHNIQDKLWVFGINFIKVVAITSYKYLLIFEDQTSLDNFDEAMLHPLFRVVKYTNSAEVTTKRLAKLVILGLPIFAWTVEVFNKLLKKWGSVLNPPTTLEDFTTPSITIETTEVTPILESTIVSLGGIHFSVTIFEDTPLTGNIGIHRPNTIVPPCQSASDSELLHNIDGDPFEFGELSPTEHNTTHSEPVEGHKQ